MRAFNRLSIQSKLMTMLLAVSIGSISVIAYEGYRSGRTAILNSVEERLLSLRSAQATQLEELAPKATLGHFGRNESVICQGQNDVKVHFVLAGSAIATFTNEQGHSHTIDEISRGDFFGYSALLARAPSPMTVTATADLEVLVMEVDAVQKMLNRTPRFAQQVSAVIESRQQRLKQLQRKQNKNGSLLSSS